METIINVGLSVDGIEPKDQLFKTIELVKPSYWRVEQGEWNGVKERCMVGVIHDPHPERILTAATVMLNQDAIAYIANGVGYVANNPLGKYRWEFNMEFFRPITRTGGISLKL